MKKRHPDKPTRPGRGHGKERGRLFYVMWGLGIIGFLSFPVLSELVPKLVHRAIYIVPALLGVTEAQHEMAHSYKTEKFYSGNDLQGFRWHMKAAKQGDEKAMYHISDLFVDVEISEVIEHAKELEREGQPDLAQEIRDAIEIKKKVEHLRFKPTNRD